MDQGRICTQPLLDFSLLNYNSTVSQFNDVLGKAGDLLTYQLPHCSTEDHPFVEGVISSLKIQPTLPVPGFLWLNNVPAGKVCGAPDVQTQTCTTLLKTSEPHTGPSRQGMGLICSMAGLDPAHLL